jgi:hypothetical protein
MGSNSFCFKACDPNGSRAGDFCQHIYDRVRCEYNAPNEAKDGVFEACKGESQDPPGVHTGVDGQTSKYTQPAAGIELTSRQPTPPRYPHRRTA